MSSTIARRTNRPHLDRARRIQLGKDVEAALERWVSELSAHTRRSYDCGLRQFAEYLYAQGLIANPSVDEAGAFVVASQSPRDANLIVQAWLESMAAINPETGVPYYTIPTINQRAAAIRWAVKQARRHGMIQWHLDVAVPKVRKDPRTGRMLRKAGRDMEGPPLEDVRRMLLRAREDGDLRAEVTLLLIFNETLRRSEILAINVEDVDLVRRVVQVHRKKRDEPEPVYLSEDTTVALRALKQQRRVKNGPLLVGKATGSKGRISEAGITYILDKIARKCGITTSPHKIRHSSLTVGDEVRTELGLDEKAAMNRAGQKSSQAYHRYLDRRETPVRAITEGVAARLAAEAADGPRNPPKKRRSRSVQEQVDRLTEY